VSGREGSTERAAGWRRLSLRPRLSVEERRAIAYFRALGLHIEWRLDPRTGNTPRQFSLGDRRGYPVYLNASTGWWSLETLKERWCAHLAVLRQNRDAADRIARRYAKADADTRARVDLWIRCRGQADRAFSDGAPKAWPWNAASCCSDWHPLHMKGYPWRTQKPVAIGDWSDVDAAEDRKLLLFCHRDPPVYFATLASLLVEADRCRLERKLHLGNLPECKKRL
jgi:hypothetical protein